MELDDLRYFIAAYESAGLMRAETNSLGLQAATRVVRLQKLVGHALFEKRGARVVPTAAGQELYAEALRRVAASERPGDTTILRP